MKPLFYLLLILNKPRIMYIEAVPFNERPFGQNAKLQAECRDGRKHVSQCVVYSARTWILRTLIKL